MASSGEIVRVNDRGVVLRTAGSDPLVVDLNGRAAWSFTPDRDGLPRPNRVLIPWPVVMRPYLNGAAQVRVSDVEGRVYFEDTVTFGDGVGQVELVDDNGFALSVDKAGHLVRAFSERDDDQRREILDSVLRLVIDLRERCGIDAFLNFGALLGAIREGKMLDHDSDIDLAYVSRHTSPADVISESYDIERGLRELGWAVLRMSGNDVKASLLLGDGSRCGVDIFPGFYVDGLLYLLPNRSGDLPLDDIAPPSTVTLLGRDFPAPRHPEKMLEYLYGPGWRVPDPSFKFDNPPEGVRRITGWMRGAQYNVQAWADHWTSPAGKAAKDPSAFALWVDEQIGATDPLLELGAGRGIDATYFANKGHRILATDFSSTALNHMRLLAQDPAGAFVQGMLTVENLRIGDLRHVMWVGAKLARAPRHIYARQLLGSLTPRNWEQLWTIASMALRRETKMFLEFSAMARGKPASRVFRPGMMRRIDADRICEDIVARGGVIEYRSIEAGIDTWGNPDPSVCRLIVSWTRPERTADA